MKTLNNYYKIGVYGSRNVCIQVSDKRYATYSFVSGMSTGFSGNLGFPLPKTGRLIKLKNTQLEVEMALLQLIKILNQE